MGCNMGRDNTKTNELEIEKTERFVEARHKLKPVLIWAGLVGILTGLVGGSFRIAVRHLIAQRTQLAQVFSSDSVARWLVYSLISGLMVFLSFWLMRRFAPDTGGSGIPQIEGALDNLLPLNWKRVLPIKFFGGILSLGANMVGGYEGPTIQMGGSIGKMIGCVVNASADQTRTLIAAGAGAGLAAAFNAPLAGILFVTEEVRPKFDSWITSFRAVMIACVTATIVVRVLLGQGAFLKMSHYYQIPLESLWMFVVLGIGLGVVGYFFNFFLFRSLDWFSKLRGLPYKLLGLLVGTAIGLLALLYPPIVGSGDDAVIWALYGAASGYWLIFVFFARFALTMFCYGSGAIGGIFAPMLAITTIFSLGVAKGLYQWFPSQIPEPGVFAVAGMGALVAATVRAPFTAIMLTMELTGNYFVVLPVLITCIAASMTAHGLGGEPIYSVLLKRTLDKASSLPQKDSV